MKPATRTRGRVFACSWTEWGLVYVLDSSITRTAVPSDDRQVVGVCGPIYIVGLGLEFLQFHGILALSDLVVGESLEVRGETKPGHDGDEPLCRIILVPLDGISVVHGELMVEVVVTFTNGDESSDNMISRSVLVIKGCFTEIVSERVDAKGGLGKDQWIARDPKKESLRDERRRAWQQQHKSILLASHPKGDLE